MAPEMPRERMVALYNGVRVDSAIATAFSLAAFVLASPAPTESHVAITQPWERLSIEAVRGDLSSEVVKAYLAKRERELRVCYLTTVRRREHPGDGRIRLTVNIAAGEATKVAVTKSDFEQPDLEDCLLKKVRRWRFPEAPAKSVVTFSVAFWEEGALEVLRLHEGETLLDDLLPNRQGTQDELEPWFRPPMDR